LIHEDRGEGVPVSGEKFLQEGGAAAGRGDDEDGPADLLPTKGGKEDVVEGPADRHDDPEGAKEQEKEGGDQPAARAERLPEVSVEESLGS